MDTRSLVPLALACVPALAAPANAQTCLPTFGDLITVDDSGGADFTSLQAAIDAAADGDFLRVFPGLYDGAVIGPAKSLRIFGPETAATSPSELAIVTGQFRVAGLPAAKSLVVRGMHVASNDPLDLTRVENCQGSVWFEACTFFAQDEGLSVFASAAVTLVDCLVQGLPGAGPGVGVSVDGGSSLALFDCRVEGESTTVPSADGGDALVVGSAGASWLSLADCEVSGGAGGDGDDTCGAGGDGGDGVVLSANSVLQRMDTSIDAGAAGAAGCGPAGTNGTALVEPLGSLVIDEPCLAREVRVRNSNQVGDPVSLRIEGEPGDVVWILGSVGSTHFSSTASACSRLVLDFTNFFFVTPAPVTLDASGTALFTLTTTALCDDGGLIVYAQGLFLDAVAPTTTPPWILSTPTTVIVYTP